MNRKVIIIAICIISVFVCFGVYYFVTNRPMDVEIWSIDGKACFRLENATTKKPIQIGDFYYEFYSRPGRNFFNDCVKDHLGYLYSVDAQGRRLKGEAETYVFCVEGHYFCVNTSDTGSAYHEMFGEYAPYNRRVFPVVAEFPFSEKFIYTKDFNDYVLRVPWTETVGLTSFEDLKEFYSRIDEDYYSVDEENMTIWLAPLDAVEGFPRGEKPDTSFIRLRALEDGSGFDMKLMKYISVDTGETIVNESEEIHDWQRFEY